MLELVLILLPKVRNIFLFPCFRSKGTEISQRQCCTLKSKKREKHPVQLITKISQNSFTLMVSKNVSFQADFICKQFFISAGVRQRSYQQQPENKRYRQNVCI